RGFLGAGARGGAEGRALADRVGRAEIRALHAVALGAVPARVAEHLVVDRERDADGAAGVARGGLDPEPPERALAQQPPVADAVEPDPTCGAGVLHPLPPGPGPRPAGRDLRGPD